MNRLQLLRTDFDFDDDCAFDDEIQAMLTEEFATIAINRHRLLASRMRAMPGRCRSSMTRPLRDVDRLSSNPGPELADEPSMQQPIVR